jgi:hypothetical protein
LAFLFFFSQAACQREQKIKEHKTSLEIYEEALKKSQHQRKPSEEERQIGEKIFNALTVQCSGSFYIKQFSVSEVYDSRGKPTGERRPYNIMFLEMKEAEWRFDYWNDHPNDVDKLNKIEIYANYLIEAKYSRVGYTTSNEYVKAGDWSDWSKNSEVFRKQMVKRNGQWEPEFANGYIDGGNGMKAPTCEEVLSGFPEGKAKR